VCANLAEAWRKHRYTAAFIVELSDAETQAAETQGWLEFAVKCGHLDQKPAAAVYATYGEILRMVVVMTNYRESWTIRQKKS